MNRLLVERGEDNSLIVQRRQRVTLVMLSGGIDSVYTLVKLLRETDDRILAHHIDMINDERRWGVEREACRAVVDYCRKAYRDFGYSESGVDHRGMRFFDFDMVTVGFEAGIVAHAYFEATGQMPDCWTIGACTEEGSHPDRWVHVEACLAANCYPNPAPPFFSLPVVSKVEECRYLPSDLLDLCWTCRRPVKTPEGYRECGVCETCQIMKRTRSEKQAESRDVLRPGAEAAEIL